MRILEKLQRETSSGRFIPEIDGLRFLAIVWVVLLHFDGFVRVNTPAPFTDGTNTYPLLSRFLEGGHQGVMLFFVISGFILALPFANHHIRNGKKIRLKDFYLRRLTRLEPPYILALLGLFTAYILIGKYTFGELLPSLLASLVYVHQFVFGQAPLIATVAWSLEIEVQFYLLAPFIAYVFAIPNAWVRRVVIVLIIVAFAALRGHSPLPVTTLFEFVHFFLLGFLLADLYVSEVRLNLGNGAAMLVGLPIFAGLLFTESGGSLGLTLLYLGLIFCFYYLVLTTAFWQWCFSRLPITVIGGMCYSIYLLHFAIIAFVGKLTLRLRVTEYYLPNLLMQALLILPIVLIVCGLYFYLIEKPCMSRDWYIRLYRRFFGKSALATGPALGETPVNLPSDSVATIGAHESTPGGSAKITSRIE